MYKKLFDQLKSNFFLVIKWAPVYSIDYATHFLASNTLKNKEFKPKGPHFSSYFTITLPRSQLNLYCVFQSHYT